MTEEAFIKASFLDFVEKEIERVRRDGHSAADAAKLVLKVSFDTTVYAWKEAYGSIEMAEYFYRIADGLVDISNKEKVK